MAETLLTVDNITIRFALASEKIDSMKDYVVKRLKGVISYNDFYALKDVSFTMNRGESIGLIGLNGSGKSTLLKAIAGVLKPYKGSVNVFGSIAPLIELGAGFDIDLTAEENVYLNGALLGYNHEEMEQYYDDIVEFSELGPFMSTPIKNFSSGMLARLGFSVATIGKPDLLIVDEALSVGDAKFQKKCEERIQDIMARGTSLLYVSHAISQVERICERVIWIEKGQIKEDGSAKDIIPKYKEAY